MHPWLATPKVLLPQALASHPRLSSSRSKLPLSNALLLRMLLPVVPVLRRMPGPLLLSDWLTRNRLLLAPSNRSKPAPILSVALFSTTVSLGSSIPNPPPPPENPLPLARLSSKEFIIPSPKLNPNPPLPLAMLPTQASFIWPTKENPSPLPLAVLLAQ